MKPGDWICDNCNVHNFKSRTRCYGCCKDKKVEVPAPTINLTQRTKQQGGSGKVEPGDWSCDACNMNNFKSRKLCYGCSKARTPEHPVYDRRNGGADRGGQFEDWQCVCGGQNFAYRKRCIGCSNERHTMIADGNALQKK